MSKRNAAPDAPKPIEMPNPENAPAVVAARQRYEDINGKLSATQRDRKDLERDIGARAGESDEDLEARMLARGLDTDKLTRLRELRRTEQVTEKALAILRNELSGARETAAREMTAFVKEEIFIPNVRAAVKDYLTAVKKAEAFRRLVDDIQGRGLGSGTFCPFNDRVPLTLSDQAGFAGFVAELINDGFTDRETVNAVFPGLL